MKAVIREVYGGPEVLKVVNLPIPTPGDNEILIKNHVATVTAADTFLRKGEPRFARLFLGLRRPKNQRVGTGFAGEVVTAGKNVNEFQTGDRVYGETAMSFGANAEYICLNASKSIVQHIPENVSYEEAAPICDGVLTSYNFLVDIGKVDKGHHVLINGAAGALGTAAIQIAKSRGAYVTAVCSSKNNDFVKSLGADETIDYHKKDFTKNHNTYDLIFDSVGKSSFSKTKKSLTEKGIYLSPVLNIPLLFTMIRTGIAGKKKAKFQATGMRKPKDLNSLLKQIHELFGRNELKIPIEKRYAIEEVVSAHRHTDSGHKRGNLIISLLND